MTDAVASPDLVPATQPAPQPAPPVAPPVAPAGEEPTPGRRRRLVLLLILLSLLTFLVGFAIWYFLFRQPLETIIPNLDELARPPAYQTSLYGLSKPLGVAVTGDGSRIYVTQSSGDQATVVLNLAGDKLATLAPPDAVVARASQLYVAVNPRTGDVYASDRSNGAVFVYASDGTYKSTFDPSSRGGTATGVWQPLAIAFDRDGNLYVSDVGGPSQTVHVFGPDGTWLRDLGSAGLFSFPNGITVDAAGNVYVADSNNGRLLVFDKSGAQLGAIQRGTSHGSLSMPRGVAIDGRGRVFVVDAVGQSVQFYRALQAGDSAPQYLASFGQQGTSDGSFEYPNGIAVDGRGRVYVTDWNNDRLQVWGY
jgi:DNA-binding beta-propeller fold protein YncE